MKRFLLGSLLWAGAPAAMAYEAWLVRSTFEPHRVGPKDVAVTKVPMPTLKGCIATGHRWVDAAPSDGKTSRGFDCIPYR